MHLKMNSEPPTNYSTSGQLIFYYMASRLLCSGTEMNGHSRKWSTLTTLQNKARC